MLDRSEHAVIGDKEDGHEEEEEERRAAAQTISGPWQGDGGVLEALGEPSGAFRVTE